ncbi:protein LOW PSII ACCUMULATION 2, chloroplastic [Abrus precatorius]|uniref:Protein LOW PSII ACCUMULATION 2, chloroplastic n=1 Tax=Abrus precatorius TaxID=3816 RepID=A0A8B8LIA0_ABRPR|nr:protein LOW PSII ACCUMULATION 2, chloroplastic [Abrus precatorius]
MVLQTQFLSSVRHSVLLFSPIQLQPKLTITIRSQKPSESSPDDSASPKPGVGFGSSDTVPANSKRKQKQKQKGQRERASIIRRTPLEKPAFVSEQQVGQDKEQSKNESAFLLAWLGFGVVILVQGIGLAASGFLPEQWDTFFVKYLYPSFTPTVFLFVAGGVGYGVYKYLQNEKTTEQK